jgi:hypothetical protein
MVILIPHPPIGLQWVSSPQHSLLVLTTPSVLHPALKLEYFRTHNWKAEWIEVVEELVREVYKKDYKVKAKSDKEVDKPDE